MHAFRPYRLLLHFSIVIVSLLQATSARAGGAKSKDSRDQVALASPPAAPGSPSPSRHARAAEGSIDSNAAQSWNEPTHADEPAFKAAALLGYSTNDLNLGLGVRAGKSNVFPHVLEIVDQDEYDCLRKAYLERL
jgi:hypothetical protein